MSILGIEVLLPFAEQLASLTLAKLEQSDTFKKILESKATQTIEALAVDVVPSTGWSCSCGGLSYSIKQTPN